MQYRSVSCGYSSCHCLSLSSYLFCIFLYPSPLLSRYFLFCFFFLFSLYVLVVLLALVPMPRPPLWHRDWLCPIRSAAGEGGEWDAGSSESGAGSHHTVLRPWNVSGTTRRVSLPPSPHCVKTNPNQSVPARSQNTVKTASELLFYSSWLLLGLGCRHGIVHSGCEEFVGLGVLQHSHC